VRLKKAQGVSRKGAEIGVGCRESWPPLTGPPEEGTSTSLQPVIPLKAEASTRNQYRVSGKMKASSKSTPFSRAVGGILFLVLFIGGLGQGRGLCGDISTSELDRIQASDLNGRAEPEFSIGAWFASSVWPHISEVDGQRCPSEPTCSSYSAQAFKKHGFFIGWAMMVDRLIHEADEGRHSPLVRRDGIFKIFDPVEDNDYWWYGGDETVRD